MNSPIVKRPWHEISGRLVGLEVEGLRENLYRKYDHDLYELYYEFYSPWNQEFFHYLDYTTEFIPELINLTYLAGYSELIELYPMMPATEGVNNIVSTQFIKILNELGFKDFRTYPVRVYEIQSYYHRSNAIEEHISRNSPYHDDLYVVLQLTSPRFSISFPLEVGQKIPPKAVEFGRGSVIPEGFGVQSPKLKEVPQYLPSDWKTREYPILFLSTTTPYQLFCNSEAAKEFSKYPSLSISPPVSN
jgi:hypothetical protein